MKISTDKLKKELSRQVEELQDYLTPRLFEIFFEIINEEFSEEEEIPLFDFIVYIIFRADKGPSESIANLMALLTPEKCEELDDEILSNSAALVRDYLKKDYIRCILSAKNRNRLPIENESISD